MRVVLETSRVSGDGKTDWKPGDEVDLPNDEAARLIEKQLARPIETGMLRQNTQKAVARRDGRN